MHVEQKGEGKNMRGEDDKRGGKVKDNERREGGEKVTGRRVKNVEGMRNVGV